MLWSLSWDDDNWQCIIHTLGKKNHALTVVLRLLTTDGACFIHRLIYYHALTVVMRRWHLTEQVSDMRGVSPCSERCHETMTNDGAWFITMRYISMLWPLPWDDDNWRSMFHTLGMYNHALTVVIRRRQLSDHVSKMYDILSCFDQCHETMTTDRAWLIP